MTRNYDPDFCPKCGASCDFAPIVDGRCQHCDAQIFPGSDPGEVRHVPPEPRSILPADSIAIEATGELFCGDDCGE